mmetsp:Transcript_23588/g.39313  ORF Transcript_23588/g.39313 Transcript_23588/m.39313 type:complete len:185 (+) Transcript_23588:856-1410(+)
MLLQQADQVLRDSVAILRKENGLLMVELNDAKSDSSLKDDQMEVLRSAVRDLEASLCREKEFNAENRRLNADYLVNVLRKFLMSTEPTERAKLVQVLCQILQFRPEESKEINQKWAVRGGGGGGLVGWLLPPRAPTSSNVMGRKHTSKADGGGGAAGGTAGAAASNNDATYDPSTGGGIDVNMY